MEANLVVPSNVDLLEQQAQPSCDRLREDQLFKDFSFILLSKA